MADDKNDKGGSFLKDIVIGMPFGIAASKALSASFKSKSFGAEVSVSDIFQFARQPKTGLDLNWLAEQSSYMLNPEGAELARQSWLTAVSSTDPLANEVLNFAGNIKTAPYNQVYSSIEQTLMRNNSLFMTQSYSKFKRNFGILKRHMDLGLSLPALQKVQNLVFPRARNMAINDLPAELLGFYNRFTKDTGIYGTGVQYYTRQPWANEGLGTYVFDFFYKKRAFKIYVPMSNKGILAEGLTQSSIHIAPDVFLFDPRSRSITSKMSRHEYFLQDIEKSILPHITSGSLSSDIDIQKAINVAYQRNIYALENIPNIVGSSNKAWEAYRNTRSKAVDIRVLQTAAGEVDPFTSVFRGPTEREATQVLGLGGLYPFTSPKNISAGRYSQFDPTGWSMTPPDVDWSRQPRQMVREWRMSAKAVESMMQSSSKWSIFETQPWRQDFGRYSNPFIRTMYIDPQQHGAMLESLGMKEGEALIADMPALRKQLQFTRIAPPIPLASVTEGLAEKIAGGGTFKIGEVLGQTVEGDILSYKPGMKLLGLEDFQTDAREQYKALKYLETVKPSGVEKFFGPFKGLGKFTDPFAIEKGIASVTQNIGFTSLQGQFILASMDDIKKDRGKFNTQLITSLWDLIDRTRTQDFIKRNAKLAAFMRSPTTFASYYRQKATSHEGFVQRLIELAVKEGKLTPEEFGTVFGGLPTVLGAEATSRLVPNETFRSRLQGMALAVTQPIYGGPAELTGAGAMGSLEPRAFDLLRSGQYGALGKEIATDLASRLAISNPEKLARYEALTKTLSSLTGKVASASGAEWDISKQAYSREAFQSFIEGGGGLLKTAGYSKSVFVPGGDVLRPFMTPSGEELAGDLANEYHMLANKLGRLYHSERRANVEEASNIVSSFIANIGQQQAPFGKGAGAIGRGKLSGSVFLRGVSGLKGSRASGLMTVGVPEEYGMRMFEDLMEQGTYSSEQVGAMQRRFLAGESVGGMLARHPFIGPYSLQPIGIQIAKGIKEPIALLPSFRTNIRLAGESVANPIELSPLVGLAGDLDADIYSVSLVSPGIEQKIKKQFLYQDDDMTRSYMEHTIRSQIIKAKAPKSSLAEGAVTLKMIADAKKLGTTQTWVPLLSTEFSQARRAVSTTIEGQRAANAMFLLQWLEQVPISGRHLDPQRVLDEEMSSLFKTVHQSFRSRNAVRLEGAVESILSKSDETARRLLTADVKIEEGIDAIREISGAKGMRDVLPSVNIHETSEDIMNALEFSSKAGVEELANLSSGRWALKTGNLDRYLAYSGSVLETAKSTFSNVAKASLVARNKIMSIGAGLWEHRKGVGYGFLGSLALATALSSPDETIGPGAQIVPNSMPAKDYSKAIKRMQPTDLTSSPGPMGQPSIPSRTFVPTVRITPGASEQVNVRMSGQRSNLNRFAEIAAANNRTNRVNINIRDNTDDLNVYNISNRILR